MKLIGIVLCCVLIPMSTLAVTNYFEDRDTFLLATGPLAMESFENLPADNALVTDTIVLPDFTVTGTYTPTCLGIYDFDSFGSFATDGVNYLAYQSGENEDLIFDFAVAINAFGMYITDWGDFGTGVLTFANDAGDFVQVDVTPHPNGNLIFFGGWNEDFTFNTVVFTQSIPGEAYGCDEIYFGIANPVATEASSWGSVKALFAD